MSPTPAHPGRRVVPAALAVLSGLVLAGASERGLADAPEQLLRERITAYLAATPVESFRIAPSALSDDPRDDFYIVIDVRNPDEFALARLPGAVNLPYHELLARIDRLPVDRATPILLYCDAALRATQALMALRLLGYDDVWYLNGSLPRWIAEDRPVERDRP